MDEQQFIQKYKDKQLTLKTYQMGYLSTYLVFVDGSPLEGLEEEIFWTLLPYTEILYEEKDMEVLKLLI